MTYASEAQKRAQQEVIRKQAQARRAPAPAPRLSEAQREQIRTRLQKATLAEWRDGMSEVERWHLREALRDRGMMYPNYESRLPAGVRNALTGESRRRKADSGRHVSWREILSDLAFPSKR